LFNASTISITVIPKNFWTFWNWTQ